MPPIHKDRRRRLGEAAVAAAEAQAAAAAATDRRDRLIWSAVQAGATIRQVADVTDLSVTQVQRVVQGCRWGRK